MLDHLAMLAGFYWRPNAAVARILDNGRIGWSFGLAMLVAAALFAIGEMVQTRADAQLANEYENVVMEQSAAMERADSGEPQRSQLTEAEILKRRQKAAIEMSRRMSSLTVRHSLIRGLLPAPENALREAILIGLIAAPLCIALIGAWDGLGRGRAYLSAHFASVFACLALAWAAAKLVAIPLEALRLATPDDPVWGPWVAPASSLLFGAFGAVVLRTALGARWSSALSCGVIGAVALSFGAVFSFAFGGLYFLASPCILYYLWMSFGGSLATIGNSLYGQQNFHRTMQATAINPHDADAQNQLGQIELKRRNFDKAEERFRAALKIDSQDADYWFSLGTVLTEKKQWPQALEAFSQAVKLNPGVANHEAMRGVGQAQLELGQAAEAIPVLERYVDAREYDPAGLVFLGQALRRTPGRESEAKSAFERALEAYATLPRWRQGEMRQWERLAKQELRK